MTDLTDFQRQVYEPEVKALRARIRELNEQLQSQQEWIDKVAAFSTEAAEAADKAEKERDGLKEQLEAAERGWAGTARLAATRESELLGELERLLPFFQQYAEVADAQGFQVAASDAHTVYEHIVSVLGNDNSLTLALAQLGEVEATGAPFPASEPKDA